MTRLCLHTAVGSTIEVASKALAEKHLLATQVGGIVSIAAGTGLVPFRQPIFTVLCTLSLARRCARRIEMRSLINAINSVVVSGQVDRTNVAGIGSLRGLDLLLSSCLYSGRALYAAFLSGLKSIKPAHQRLYMAEQRMFAMAAAPCWHPAELHTGSPAFACIT